MRILFIIGMVKKLVFVTTVICLIQHPCFSENKQRMDSLKMALPFEKKDTSKLNIYIKLLQECDQENNHYYGNLLIDFVDKKLFLQTDDNIKKKYTAARINALLAVNSAFNRKKDSIPHFTYLSKKQKYYLSKKDIEGYVHVTKILANEFSAAGDILKSVQQCKAGLIVLKKYHFKSGEGMLLDGLTKNFLIIGDTVEALINLKKAIAVYVQAGDSTEQAAGYRMLGAIYGLKSKALYANSAINYLEKSKKINSLIKNDEGYFLSLIGLANLYTMYEEYGLALNFYNQALSFASEKSMKYEVALTYQNIGVIYLRQKNIDLARSNINAALEIANKFKIEDRIIYGKKYLSETYFIEKKFAIAKKLMSEAAEVNNIHGNEETKKDFELRLYRIDSASNNHQEALFHFQNYNQLKTRLNSEELKKITLQEKFKRDYDKKKASDQLAQEKKEILYAQERKRQQTILISVLLGLIAVIIFSTFIYRSLNIRKKQNQIITTQKTAIESSYKNLALLNNISNEITSSLNLSSVMELIYKNVSALMDVSFFIISTYDKAEDAVDVKFCVKQNEVVPLNFKTYLSDPKSILTALTVRNKKEIIIQDWAIEYRSYQNEPAQLKDNNDLYCDSMIWIPLLIKNEVIGLFSVQSIPKNAFTPNNIEILRSLSSIIAVALNNAEAYHKIDAANLLIQAQKDKVSEKNKSLEESFNNIEIISKIGQKITSTLNLQEVIEGVFDYLNTVMDAQGFSVYLYNHENQTLELKYGNEKYKFANADSISMEEQNSFGVWCIKNKKEVFINDIKNEYRNYVSNFYWQSNNDNVTIQSFINIPLFIKDDAIGFVSIHSFNKNAYSKSHLEVFKSLSSYVAVALNNAEAYHKIDNAKIEITAQKNIVEEKQKEILDSIEYALRIQTAILPPQKIVKQHLENSFILYKPKDIVAGDFYWMETVQLADEKNQLADERISGLANEKNTQLADERISGLANEKNIQLADERISGLANEKNVQLADERISGLANEKNVQLADERIGGLADEKNVQLADESISGLADGNKLKNNQLIIPLANQLINPSNQLILFAACDCTGHGVPGAMVSVVCHNALNRAVREFGLIEPAKILDKTQEIVLENFSKSEEDIKDGMDISLCALNFNKVQDFVKVELQWAGANNPLWLIHNSEFIETKADKQPIGMNEDSKAFTNHTFHLEKGDTIYIFSDGFADQFSPADKKLMKKNFKNLLLSIHDKNMQEQHEYLNNYIENWKGNMEQTDDILVIGVRV